MIVKSHVSNYSEGLKVLIEELDELHMKKKNKNIRTVNYLLEKQI